MNEMNMANEMNDLAYGMTIEVNGVSEAYDMDLDYGMTYEGANEVSCDDLAYGMTVEELINTEEFQEAFEDFRAFLNESIKRLKER